MKLVQLSDCHLFGCHEKTGYGDIAPVKSLKALLQQVMSESPDAVVITGDISGDDSVESYTVFANLMKHYLRKIPWRVIPGNHDNNAAFESVLATHWLRAGHPWSVGNVYVHGLDTRFRGTLGLIDAVEIEATLAAYQHHACQQHLLCLHHHPVTTHSWMDKHRLHNVELLDKLLDDTNITAIIHGHIHAETVAKLQSTPVYGAPSTCWQWQLGAAFGLDDCAPGYRVITMENNQLSTFVRRKT